VITIIEDALKKSDLTDDQKKELADKIHEVISNNHYQKKSYQKQKNKVDKLLAILKGETDQQDFEEVP